MSEHRVIERVLACLKTIAVRCAADGKLDRPAAEQALDFFHHFVDGSHHIKEDDHLFPAMEPKGFHRDFGPTHFMRLEHQECHQHLEAMNAALGGAADGDAEAVRQFNDNARGYIKVLGDHIIKEDYRLFPLVNQVLGVPEQEAVLAAFTRIENEADAGTHEAYLRLADQLADHCGVPHAHAVVGNGHNNCSCPQHAAAPA